MKYFSKVLHVTSIDANALFARLVPLVKRRCQTHPCPEPDPDHGTPCGTDLDSSGASDRASGSRGGTSSDGGRSGGGRR